ncbi:hypothetical protein LTR53_020185, partial [Teratosphaeriaceae sp. CCFEE 6253]
MLTAPLVALQRAHAEYAMDVFGEKKKWKWPTIRAFVWNDGRHVTKNQPRESWDQHFAKAAFDALAEQWIVFETRLSTSFDGVEHALVEI